MTTLIKHSLKYVLIVAIAAFLSFGGPQPTTKTSQNGSSTTVRNYGQPFNFHTNVIYTSATGTVMPLTSTGYRAKETTALVSDIIIWSLALWLIVRMAEQKPIAFRRKRLKTQA
jgi:hypothetical protein